MVNAEEEDRAAILAESARIEVECGKFVGLLPDEATALAARLGILVRVVYLDVPAWSTPDRRLNRMTVEVKHGRVLTASVG